MIRIAIFILIIVLIDIYAFQAFRFLTKKYSLKTIRRLNVLYLSFSVFCFLLILLAPFNDWYNFNKYFRTYSFAILFILISSKIVFDIFILTDDIIRLFRWIIKKISNWVKKPELENSDPQALPIKRSEFIVKAGLFLAAVQFQRGQTIEIWG